MDGNVHGCTWKCLWRIYVHAITSISKNHREIVATHSVSAYRRAEQYCGVVHCLAEDADITRSTVACVPFYSTMQISAWSILLSLSLLFSSLFSFFFSLVFLFPSITPSFSLIHSFTYPFAHSLVHPLVHSLARSSTRSLARLLFVFSLSFSLASITTPRLLWPV